MFKLYDINLQLFAEETSVNPNTQTTGSANLTPEMKTFYSDYLIDTAAPKLVHDQFGQKHPIPRNGGKTIEFRKFNPLPKLHDQPLTEGVTPNGQTMSVSKVEATVTQYGGYVTLSDMYLLSAIDNNLVYATKLLGNQAGATLDTVTREVLNGGTNVVYAGDAVSRSELITAKNKLTVADIKKAVRALKVQNAPKIGDSYVGIIHPDCTYDLTNDPDWKHPHQYVDTDNIYSGEIGRIAGVRFVESSESKVVQGNKPLTTNGSPIVIKEVIVAMQPENNEYVVETNPYIDTKVFKQGAKVTVRGAGPYTVSSFADGKVKFDSATNIVEGDILVSAGTATSVYSTLILGEDAYGVTELEGGGLEHITKALGAGDDPLNQRATCGWKATKVAERLVEPYMVRIESCSTFNGDLN